MSSTKLIKVPWNEDEIRRLKEWQKNPYIHPYTCGNDECRAELIPTKDGWICNHCDYTQEWAMVLVD